MKAMDFDLSKDLRFDVDTGVTSFRDTRVLVFDSGSIGLLRQNLIDEIGWDKARGFFLKLGFQNGYSDFLQMKLNYDFDTEMDLLASGPVIHTWEGIVHAKTKEIHFDRDSGEFYFTGVWSNSYEAEQHLSFNQVAKEPVCWSLMGYASGWGTAFFERPLLAMEPMCVGQGHNHCEWLIQPPDVFGGEARPYIEALEEFWKL